MALIKPTFTQVATGLRFPEGPVAMPDGSVILVEIERRTLSRVTPDGKVYPNYVEFEAGPAAGGTLCQNGKWRAFDGGANGTTPFRVFFKDGVVRGFPLDK